MGAEVGGSGAVKTTGGTGVCSAAVSAAAAETGVMPASSRGAGAAVDAGVEEADTVRVARSPATPEADAEIVSAERSLPVAAAAVAIPA